MSFGTSDSLRTFDGERPVRLRGVDMVLSASCALAALVLVGPARWAPGALANATIFALFAAGPLVLRVLEARGGVGSKGFAFLADFWLLPVSSLAHGLLNPVVDALNPLLKDAQLVELDQRLFGGQTSVILSSMVPPWLNEVLMFCYYGHFMWPLLLGLLLYFTGRHAQFHEYLLGLALLFAFNYAAYSIVPAIGPRYYLFGSFLGPVQGLYFTPVLDSMMRSPGFARDCFPSGHTGATLVVLFYAFRFSRRFFWVMLFPGLGLIVATLAGRFHYLTDLLCAVPLVAAVVGLSLALSRAAARREEFAGERSVPVDAIVRP
ncbi:phosphatase PAP2 family protein [Myxococcaceae bacterium GXIMD 01537]